MGGKVDFLACVFLQEGEGGEKRRGVAGNWWRGRKRPPLNKLKKKKKRCVPLRIEKGKGEGEEETRCRGKKAPKRKGAVPFSQRRESNEKGGGEKECR